MALTRRRPCECHGRLQLVGTGQGHEVQEGKKAGRSKAGSLAQRKPPSPERELMRSVVGAPRWWQTRRSFSESDPSVEALLHGILEQLAVVRVVHVHGDDNRTPYLQRRL